jgi:hypothetical protein
VGSADDVAHQGRPPPSVPSESGVELGDRITARPQLYSHSGSSTGQRAGVGIDDDLGRSIAEPQRELGCTAVDVGHDPFDAALVDHRESAGSDVLSERVDRSFERGHPLLEGG